LPPKLKIALIGAGSRSFGPATIRDALLSDLLKQRGVRLVLMDKVQQHLDEVADHSRDKVIQAVLLDPTVDSYRRAVEMVDEMLQLQRHILPEIR